MPIDNPDGFSGMQPSQTVNLSAGFGVLWRQLYSDALAASAYIDHAWPIPDDGFIYMMNVLFGIVYASTPIALTVYLNGTIIAPCGGIWSAYSPLKDNPAIQLIYGDLIVLRVQNLDTSARTITSLLAGTKFIRPASFGHPPIGFFTAAPLSGAHPLTVTFTDGSAYDPVVWDWDFGDGTPHSDLQNPVHIYQNAGTYTPRLIVTNQYGYDVHVKTNYITVT